MIKIKRRVRPCAKELMIYVVMLIVSMPAAFTQAQTGQKKNGWDNLFDGKTLKGWKVVGGNARYTVEKGAIVGTYSKGTPTTFLVTEKEYGDFVLELEVKLDEGALNSGIQTRSYFDSSADQGKGKMIGRQVEIENKLRGETGGVYDESRRGWLYPLDLNEQARAAFKPNVYNKLRIEAIGDELRTWVNDVPVAHVIDTLDSKGVIGLQVHSAPDALAGKKIYFKNIRVQTENIQRKGFSKDVYAVNLKPNNLSDSEREAGYSLLFDGQYVDQWRSVKSMDFPKKGWEIKDGTITVLKSDGGESTNGGDIVTRDQFAVFDLSFEFKMTPGANSGVKYFVTLKEKTTGSAIGLEFQVLDDVRHPDAKKGRDGNRTLASLYDLMTSDKNGRSHRQMGEWNRGRVVVTADNQVTHYLNGIKVLTYKRGSQEFKDLVAHSKYKDWEGFGVAPTGHILLQDHGDRVSFRSIKVKKIK